MFDFAAAEALAERLHAGQRDRSGAPYIGHLRRVAAHVGRLGGSDPARVAAILHDAVEDGHITFAELRALGAPERVLGALDAVTRRAGETYRDFVERAATDPDGALVKYADLLDNTDPARLALLDPAQARRLLRRYEPALALLRAALFPGGDTSAG